MEGLNTDLVYKPVPLQTERLNLLPVSEEAKTDIGKLLSDPQVRKAEFYMPVLNPKAYESWWHKQQLSLDSGKMLRYVAYLKSDNSFCGLFTLKEIDPGLHRAELGYSSMPRFWGKGMAYEASLKLVEHGFKQLKLHSIFAIVSPESDGPDLFIFPG